MRKAEERRRRCEKYVEPQRISSGSSPSNSRTTCLLLTLEDPAHRLDKLFEGTPAFPFVERDLVGCRKIRQEVATEPIGDRLLAEGDVHFVVVLERTIVQVRRSDDGPR